MNIYISGLSYGTNDADLTNLFAEFGEVSSAKVIFDRETGRSRGFAFVEMPNDTEGQKAIDELNGVEYDQKVISVSVARPRTEDRLTVVAVVVIITLEDINIRIKAEDIIFCFYLISYFRFMIQRRNLLIDTGEDKKSYYI